MTSLSAHVHLNEPGRTEWEGFYTGTRAAASGGVTTVVDMPLNSIPPTVTVNYLEVKRKAATGQCAIDVAFWGGVIPGNQVQRAFISSYQSAQLIVRPPCIVPSQASCSQWSQGFQVFPDRERC